MNRKDYLEDTLDLVCTSLQIPKRILLDNVPDYNDDNVLCVEHLTSYKNQLHLMKGRYVSIFKRVLLFNVAHGFFNGNCKVLPIK